MAQINLNNFKVITDKLNTFFVNNKFMTGESIPTEGIYSKGDVLVNIGENASAEPMWICVEGGEPGTWEVVGVGAGGGGNAGKMVTLKSRQVANTAVSEVAINISGFNKATDMLMVFANNAHMVEGVDYEIDGSSTKIVAKNGNWNEMLASNFTFDFVVIKMIETVEGIASSSQMVCLKNTVIIDNAVSEVEIGIEGFNNEYDKLTVYRNSVYMIEGIDYRVEGGKIVSLKGNWNASGESDYKFTFEVMKLVAKVNPDAVVGMEHLTEDVKQAIEAAGNIDMSKYDSKLVELEGKVNEAFQNANNGKQLIANAIGEPVSADDTFQAMSDGINSLLSTFKTNMMNSGVTVESGDRFKALIDKIKGLTEGEGNKGIQYASGESISFLDNVYKFSINLSEISFTPSLIIATTVWNSAYVPMIIYTTLDTDIPNNKYFFTQFVNTAEGTQNLPVGLYEVEIYDNTLYFTSGGADRKYTWHAFGVGEEDTTLRDSLASILEEEGVEVTEEDDMSGLITKVDDEFDRKNNALANSSLNIISASELPATGDENQICIITNTTPSNYVITSNYNDKSTNTNVITMYTSNTASNDATEGTLVPITSGNLTTNYYFSKICQGDNRLASYIYKSGAWKQLTQNYVWFLEKGSYVNESYHGGISTGAYVQYYPTEAITVAYSSYYHAVSSFANPINLSLYKKIKCIAYLDYPNGNKTFYITLHPNRQTQTVYSNDITTSTNNIYKVADLMTNGTPKVYEMDVSSVTGEYYIGFGAYTGLNGNTFITDIWLE